MHLSETSASAGTASAAYSSIFLEPDWFHERYLGWRRLAQSADIKVLERHYGPLRRVLVISRAAGALEAALQIPQLFAGHTQVVLHDLCDDSRDFKKLGHRVFEPLADTRRILNKATFVIDLALSAEANTAALSSQRKRALKLAAKSDVVARVDAYSPKDGAALLLSLYAPMAERNGIQIPGKATIEQMLTERTAFLVSAGQGDNVNSVLLVYTSAQSGYHLYSARSAGDDFGGGTLVQVTAMQHLREMNRRWYDLGGIASTDESDGIFRFKRDFGGLYVSLGAEWHWTGPVFAAAEALKASVEHAS
jgi:hypothetical protein